MDDLEKEYKEKFSEEFSKLVEQFKVTIIAAEDYYNNFKGANIIDDSDYTKNRMELAQKFVEQIVLCSHNLLNIAIIEQALDDD